MLDLKFKISLTHKKELNLTLWYKFFISLWDMRHRKINKDIFIQIK
jgi:hypothetical protein